MKTKIEKEFSERNGQAVRLNKYISDAGVCSRREADRMIDAGRVKVDGRTAQKGMQVWPWQEVMVGKKNISRTEEMVLLAVYKPVGIVCTAEKRERNNIIRFLDYPARIFPVGRLDKDSEGLLLMTNNGELADQIMKARNHHEKEYIVTVDKEITESFLRAMAEGVPILDTVTRRCRVERIGKYTFRIILTQGLNRQIRRMCEYFDYRVTRLKRVRILNIQLGRLLPGGYRKVTLEEMEQLYEYIKE